MIEWTALSLALAIASLAFGRDISCNIFLAAVFVIQATQPAGNQHPTANKVVFILSCGVVAFLLYSWISGVQFPKPHPWR